MSAPEVNAVAAVMLYGVGVLTGGYVGYWIGRLVGSRPQRAGRGRP